LNASDHREPASPEPRVSDVAAKQLYWPDTNVLVTRFLTHEGAAELIDFMPAGAACRGVEHHEIVRTVIGVRGQMRCRMRCHPAFYYARAPHETALVDGGARFDGAGLALGLATDVPLSLDGDGVTAEWRRVGTRAGARSSRATAAPTSTPRT
jgi:hypothetical protein